MGKYSLLITLGVVAAVSVLSLQGQQTSQDTSERQARRGGEVLARQVARSGYNAVMSEARIAEQEYEDVEDIVEAVGTVSGSYEGGTYEAELKKVSPTSYKAVAIGRFPVADRVVKYRIGDGYDNNNMVNPPTIEEPSTLNVTFEQSQADWCSAIYLERVLPDTKPEDQPDPEMVFPPGHDRNDAATTFDNTIQPGTKLNFILAVDKGCDHEGEREKSVDYPEDYDHTRRSFKQDVSKLNKLEETPYAMIEETTVGSSQGWRVSFEDLKRYSDTQLWDIKENGYPDGGTNWDSEDETYGGDGWDKNTDGLRDLQDFWPHPPDFSDQVFQVAVTEPV